MKDVPLCLSLKGKGELSQTATKASHLAELDFYGIIETSVFLYSFILEQVITGEFVFPGPALK